MNMIKQDINKNDNYQIRISNQNISINKTVAHATALMTIGLAAGATAYYSPAISSSLKSIVSYVIEQAPSDLVNLSYKLVLCTEIIGGLIFALSYIGAVEVVSFVIPVLELMLATTMLLGVLMGLMAIEMAKMLVILAVLISPHIFSAVAVYYALSHVMHLISS